MDGKLLRQALESALDGRSAQIKSLGIGVFRSMILAHPLCAGLAGVLPRYRRAERSSLIQRQTRVVEEDAIPKKVAPWIGVLFRSILHHEASANWKTSKTAK